MAACASPSQWLTSCPPPRPREPGQASPRNRGRESTRRRTLSATEFHRKHQCRQSPPDCKDQDRWPACTNRARPDQLRSQQVFGVLAASAGMSWQLCMGGLQPYLRRHQRVASDRGAIEMGVGPLGGAGLQHAAHSVRYRYLAIGPGQRCAARDRWPADPLRRHLPALASLQRSEPHRPHCPCCCGHLDLAGRWDSALRHSASAFGSTHS